MFAGKIALLVIDACLLLTCIALRMPMPNWFRRVPGILLFILLLEGLGIFVALRHSNSTSLLYSLLFIPVYAVTVILIMVIFIEFRSKEHSSRFRGVTGRVAAALGLLFIGLSVAYSFQVYQVTSDEDVPVYFHEQQVADLRSVNWVTAFTALNSELSQEYPFTQWKNIDWRKRYLQYQPLFAVAQARRDKQTYFHLLRSFAFTIPDGHVSLSGNDFNLSHKATSGGFGITIIGLDNGKIVAAAVRNRGPAFKAGIKVGADIIKWNGQAIDHALSRVNLLWTNEPVTTAEGRRWEQYHYLMRAPAGTRIHLTFRNRGENRIRTVTLAAVSESDPLKQPAMLDQLDRFIYSPVTARLLPDGYGYIKITSEFPALLCFHPEKTLQKYLTRFMDAKVRGIILDVRGNIGGSDRIAKAYCGFFYAKPHILEYPGVYNEQTQKYEPIYDEMMKIIPSQPQYRGKIIVLVDSHTISAGESIPLSLKGLPSVKIVGWQGTHGSFGIGQKQILLPGGYAFRFPRAQSLNAKGQIQVDSNAAGVGGIVPDIRVPLNDYTVEQNFSLGQDVVLKYGITVLNKMK